jgi:hypothetical protein
MHAPAASRYGFCMSLNPVFRLVILVVIGLSDFLLSPLRHDLCEIEFLRCGLEVLVLGVALGHSRKARAPSDTSVAIRLTAGVLVSSLIGQHFFMAEAFHDLLRNGEMVLGWTACTLISAGLLFWIIIGYLSVSEKRPPRLVQNVRDALSVASTIALVLLGQGYRVPGL